MLASIREATGPGLAITAAVAVGAGLLAAWLTPRGPITTTAALTAVAVAGLVGVAVGALVGSRWALLVAPVAFWAALEVGRVGVVGPTVDAIHLDSTLGIIAFVLGRVVHALLVLVPFVAGWAWGRIAVRGSETGPGGWILAVGLTLAVAAFVVSAARPATTAPIVGPAVDPIAELTDVEVGGHEQSVMIRGRDAGAPVLLFLAGGPGGTEIGAMRLDTALESDFVVVTWDQRGAGKSYAALDPTETFTENQLVEDTIELTEHLRQRFGVEKVHLVGQSWGSTLGVLAVQRRPDLYHSFVGVGQMVSQRLSDVMFWEDALAWADETGRADLAATLRSNGPPPYDRVSAYGPVVSYEHQWNPYPELDLSNEMPATLFVPEYTLMDRINAFRGFLDTNGTLYPQLQDIDFRDDVAALDVPYWMVLGEHEARGRLVLAEEWFDLLEAPSKQLVVVEGAGHRANFDRPDLFAGLMAEVAATAGG